MKSNNTKTVQDEISVAQARLAELEDERERLERHISELKALLSSVQTTEECPSLGQQATLANRAAPSTSSEKIAQIMELFRGRIDVYPKRWVNIKKNAEGYAPACSNEWVRGVCDKRSVKCGECPNQAFILVTEQTFRDHLKGRHTIGVYPMLHDETCWFLAVDFD